MTNHEDRVRKILNEAEYTSYGDYNTMEITRNNGLTAHLIVVMEQVLVELKQINMKTGVPYRDKDVIDNEYFGPGD